MADYGMDDFDLVLQAFWKVAKREAPLTVRSVRSMQPAAIQEASARELSSAAQGLLKTPHRKCRPSRILQQDAGGKKTGIAVLHKLLSAVFPNHYLKLSVSLVLTTLNSA